MDKKILVVGHIGLGRTCVAALETLKDHKIEVISLDDEKGKGRGIEIIKPFIIEQLPVTDTTFLEAEKSNYINGKKLPKKKRR